MNDPLNPSVALLAKVSSLVIHYEEAATVKCHPFDIAAIRQLRDDPEIVEWLEAMVKAGFSVVKR